jgi:hypothetical protein
MDEAHNRETTFNPFEDWIGRLEVGWSAHDAIPGEFFKDDAMGCETRKIDPGLQPIWILLSETN